MRTTINLPDGLAEAAKQRAASEGRTFTSIVEEGLRRVLDTAPARRPVALPKHGSGDGRVLVDILDRDAVWEALDAERRPTR